MSSSQSHQIGKKRRELCSSINTSFQWLACGGGGVLLYMATLPSPSYIFYLARVLTTKSFVGKMSNSLTFVPITSLSLNCNYVPKFFYLISTDMCTSLHALPLQGCMLAGSGEPPSLIHLLIRAHSASCRVVKCPLS